MREDGRVSQRDLIRLDIDETISLNTNFRDFCRDIEDRGYILEYRGSFLRIRPDAGRKFFRLDRLGDGYTVEDIKERLRENYESRRNVTGNFILRKREKAKGLYALYLHYLYLLGALPEVKTDYRELNAAMREDSVKMKRYSDEAKMLVEHNIVTDKNLTDYAGAINREIVALCMSRGKLKNKLRRMHVSSEMADIKKEIREKSDRIKALRREVMLCRDIAERSGVIETICDAVEEYHKQMEKKKKQERRKMPDEHIGRSR